MILTKKSLIKNLTGSILVFTSQSQNIKKIRTSSDFFKNEIYCIEDKIKGTLTFRKPTTMYNGKTIKTYKYSKGFKFDIHCDEIEVGKEYCFNEDSNEDDGVIINYRKKQ